MLFVLSTGNKFLANSLVYQGCLIHIYLQDVSHFDSIILSNTFLCNFLLVFCFGWQLLPSHSSIVNEVIRGNLTSTKRIKSTKSIKSIKSIKSQASHFLPLRGNLTSTKRIKSIKSIKSIKKSSK